MAVPRENPDRISTCANRAFAQVALLTGFSSRWSSRCTVRGEIGRNIDLCKSWGRTLTEYRSVQTFQLHKSIFRPTFPSARPRRQPARNTGCDSAWRRRDSGWRRRDSAWRRRVWASHPHASATMKHLGEHDAEIQALLPTARARYFANKAKMQMLDDLPLDKAPA